MAGLLLDKGADPKAADGKGRTPLFALVEMQDFEIGTRAAPDRDKMDPMDLMKALIARGADLNARLTIKGCLPEEPVATDGGRDYAGMTPFLRAAQANDLPLMRYLMANGADANLTTNNHETALMLAAGIGFAEGTMSWSDKDGVEAIKLCMELGQDVNAAS